jgi:hypothetical protein
MTTALRTPAERRPARTHRTKGRRFRGLLSVAAAAGVLAAGVSAASALTASAAAPPARVHYVGRANPAHNRVLIVDADAVCDDAGADSAACTAAWVADIDAARAAEHVRPLVLPRNYRHLNGAQQVFVLTNLERVDRGLRPIAGVNANLNAHALVGAQQLADPVLNFWNLGPMQGAMYESNEAMDASAMESDWLWMYADGWGGTGWQQTTNADCTGPSSDGCWGHREAILATFAGSPILVTGVAATRDAYGNTAFSQIILGGTGRTPKLGLTWARELRAGADRTLPTAS